MVERYVRIRAEIKKVEAVEELVPTGCKHRKEDGTDIAQVRFLFDSVKSEYPVTTDYLKAGAKIVHSSVFQSAIAKTINGQVLTIAEKKPLKVFKVTTLSMPKRMERRNDYAMKLLRVGSKKQRVPDTEGKYSKLAERIPPASNVVERLFSQCKLTSTPQRIYMMPANFEMLTFLRVNINMWNASTVASVEDEISNN
ncbi:hypothetical protein PHMEG_00019605 [Phytophthora megakarya]|uniref:HAT C-terminal dimerisation domain-containing protein n=1 Tax=Phytophthora megakarya TaxID=4795 RepID=A0A225VQV7_9STRA|nr:hypothetical protein PHMEG_00019605 [Phytophthora megakarya]